MHQAKGALTSEWGECPEEEESQRQEVQRVERYCVPDCGNQTLTANDVFKKLLTSQHMPAPMMTTNTLRRVLFPSRLSREQSSSSFYQLAQQRPEETMLVQEG